VLCTQYLSSSKKNKKRFRGGVGNASPHTAMKGFVKELTYQELICCTEVGVDGIVSIELKA
jgi:hypothetical protein